MPGRPTGAGLVSGTQAFFNHNHPHGSGGGRIKNLPAFVGAEGFGADTIHARGGRVIFVDNTNDSGPGSFRDAVKQTGPRYILFRTSGTIGQADGLHLTDPNVYIAGQTAPGDGICIAGNPFYIQTTDFCIRHLRFRSGDDQGPGLPPPDGNWANRKSIQFGDPNFIGGTKNGILDHCSISWAVDENMTFLYKSNAITVQWSIISEGLYNSVHPEGPHSMGVLLSGGGGNPGNGPIALHHCLLAHHNQRGPQISGLDRLDMRNCFVYNQRERSFEAKNPNNNVIFIGNGYIHGLDSIPPLTGIMVVDQTDTGMQIYAKGNIDPRYGVITIDLDNWNIIQTNDGDSIPEVYKQGHWLDQIQSWAADITTQRADAAGELVLNRAGANKPKRDSVDSRVVQNVIDALHGNPTGHLIDSQEDVGSWPVLHPTTPPTDSNNDGIADQWCIDNGLDPMSNLVANRIEPGQKYTNIERYLSYLAGDA